MSGAENVYNFQNFNFFLRHPVKLQCGFQNHLVKAHLLIILQQEMKAFVKFFPNFIPYFDLDYLSQITRAQY